MKNLTRTAVAALFLALSVGCGSVRDLTSIITGYGAKNMASNVFVSGREAEDIENLDLHFSFIKYNHYKLDYENKTVTSRFLWKKSTAVYREGYGVTLLRGDMPEVESAKWKAEKMAGPIQVASLSPFPTQLSPSLDPVVKALFNDHTYGGHPFAFVVVHNGKVVAEHYDKGITSETRLLSWSMAKSFTQALAGIMVKDGLVDIYAPMDIPEWHGDGRRDITLNDLLQMQSGLEWNEDYGSRSDVNIMLHRETDMGLFALNKPLAYKPGTHYYYSSGSTNIVMRYLRSKFVSDSAFYSYLHTRLFGALGIRNAIFEPDMSGTPIGSSYIYITAREFARFGQMYLDDGMVEGKRILPEGWVDYTRTPGSDSKGGYGSSFWLNRDKSLPNVPEDMYCARGHDGQRIFIIPSKNLVAVVLGYSPKKDGEIDWNPLLKAICSSL